MSILCSHPLLLLHVICLQPPHTYLQYLRMPISSMNRDVYYIVNNQIYKLGKIPMRDLNCLIEPVLPTCTESYLPNQSTMLIILFRHSFWINLRLLKPYAVIKGTRWLKYNVCPDLVCPVAQPPRITIPCPCLLPQTSRCARWLFLATS